MNMAASRFVGAKATGRPAGRLKLTIDQLSGFKQESRRPGMRIGTSVMSPTILPLEPIAILTHDYHS